MSLFAFALPHRTARRLGGVLAASVAVLALAACGAPAGGGASGETRVYESEFGDVELPADIERIVSVDFYTPAALLDLGITPVGVVNSYFTDTDGGGIPVQYTTAIADSDARSIGEYYELNLEAVAQADPDVVLATQDFLPLDSPMREQIQKIAPIVTFNARDGEAWRTRATELAKILDKTAELQPLIDQYDARRDEISTQYAKILSEQAVTVFGPEPDEWGTYSEKHFITPILRDLGATFRQQQPDEVTADGFPQWFSYEELNRISNADVIFLRDGVSDEQRATLAANAIWQNLPAVQHGMVFDYIQRGPTGSYGWALGNLDDLADLLGQVQAKVDAQG
ncbi:MULTISPECIES: ABC transporter substrate-binding protein [unclassified Microbacterium]|uniref:ABC transporter substrate-binding protein n=1 Tax=unclassified Microbacterium TaxID=2609290 RepID=UPI00301741E8